MLDMVIKGGLVVTPSGSGQWDVGVSGEKIVALALPGVLPTEGAFGDAIIVGRFPINTD